MTRICKSDPKDTISVFYSYNHGDGSDCIAFHYKDRRGEEFLVELDATEALELGAVLQNLGKEFNHHDKSF